MQVKVMNGVLASVLACGAAGAASAQSDAELDAMRDEMREMRLELARLRSEQRYGEQAAAGDADDIAGLGDVRPDQNEREAGPPQFVAGHDGEEFALTDPDQNFYWSPNAQIQFRYIYNIQDSDTGGADGDPYENGFQFRRVKLKGDGYIADPKLTFKYSVEFNRDDSSANLEEAVIGYEFDSGIEIEGGRFKAPFAFDELMSSTRQLAAERSLVNEQFTIGFVEGVQLTLPAGDNLALKVMVNDGAGSGENDAQDFHEDINAEYAVTARADLTLGNSKVAKDYTSWAEDEAGINLGVAAHYEQGQEGVGAIPLDSFTRVTADVLYNAGGLSLFAAGYYETQDASDDGGAVEADPYGFLAQVGFNIDDTFEPFARYEYIDTDVDGTDSISVLTGGFNYYLKKHAAKFTLDAVFALDPLVGIGVSDGFGLRPDVADDDLQIAIRAQFQLLF